jgi:hypothetical protein
MLGDEGFRRACRAKARLQQYYPRRDLPFHGEYLKSAPPEQITSVK